MNKQKAMAILKEHGYQMTNRRKTILRFFIESDKYETAKSLYEHMEQKYPGISFDTVYRNLHLYVDLNILEATDLNSERHYRIKCADHHHHHFICNACGKTKKLNICPMETKELQQVLQSYEIADHKFEIYGYCPQCKIA